jgi:hypothetical protein
MGYREPTFRNFIAAFRGHWLEAMSGGFSVPFTALAVYSSQTYQQAIFALLALAGIWFAAFRIWAVERKARNDAEDRAQQLESEYIRALNLAAVNLTVHNQTDPKNKSKIISRSLEYVLQWENTISRPIDYEFRRLAIDGVALNPGARCSAPGHAKPMYYLQVIQGSLPAPDPEQHVIELEYI